MRSSRWVVGSVAAALLATLVSCASPDEAPPTPAPAAEHAHALHNVHRVNDQLISGAVPAGDAAFDELAHLGVRTIISVDGATPDVARATARGLRYVHIPITYAEVTESERLELARAVRDLPGPIYLHCHHGKHRGPAAAAAAAVALRLLVPADAVEFMKRAGTAPSYEGLYECVATAHAATQIELDAAPSDFPAAREAQGLVAAMVEVDEAFEHLNDIRAAGWSVPRDHPDLVPAAVAGSLTDNLRLSADDPLSREHGEEFLARLAEATHAASELEEALVRGAEPDELDARFEPVQASCTDCHARWRDRR